MKKLFLFISLILSVFAFSVCAQDSNNSVIYSNNSGRVFWRGMVDDVVRIEIKDLDLSIRTVSGRSYDDGTFSFTSPLPKTEVTVGVEKKDGRGTVEVIQQPNSSNNFTTVVEIKDLKGGAKEYHLEIYWN